MNRQICLVGVFASSLVMGAFLLPRSDAAAITTVEVYKSPTCGCCAKWIALLKQNGYAVRVNDLDDLTAIKDRYRIPARLKSCHTAVVDKYVFEGHVPIDLVRRVLAERPAFAGGV